VAVFLERQRALRADPIEIALALRTRCSLFLKIRTGAEAACAGTAHDDDPNSWIVIQLSKKAWNLRTYFLVDCINHMRTVERYPGDGVAPLNFDGAAT
jgi:hypothetical protein